MSTRLNKHKYKVSGTYYNIYYGGGQIIGQPNDEYECTVDNVDKWFEDHNASRKADGESEESIDEFVIEEINVILFNKTKESNNGNK